MDDTAYMKNEMNNAVIKNEKHVAILGSDYKVNFMSGPHTYKKGHRANTWGLYENGGEVIEEGHGIGFLIPKELFTTFIVTWDEVTVTEEGNVTVTRAAHMEEDETKDILTWWAKRDEKKKALAEKEAKRREKMAKREEEMWRKKLAAK